MKKSAFFSDVLFTFFLSWLFTLCVFRYLRISLLLSFILSGLCGLLGACSVAALLARKRKLLFLKQSLARKKQRFLDHLSLLSEQKRTEYFHKALTKATNTPLNRRGKSHLVGEHDFYFLHFRFTPASADDVATISRYKTGKQKHLLCNRIDEEAARLCAKLGIRLRLGESVYELLEKADALPETYVGEETQENKKERRLRLWFHKRNARRFVVGGALLLLSSLFTPFPYYYLVFSFLLLVAAALVRIFGYAE